ncbi:MAG: hypothetical protein R3194_11535, partial [Limnobacter sp.]|nr:hypothetical protein [Limnobacter sp.]
IDLILDALMADIPPNVQQDIGDEIWDAHHRFQMILLEKLEAIVALLLALVLGADNSIVALPVLPDGYVVFVLLVFSGLLVAANYALQYGASLLPANVTAVVMLSEVVFATLSAIWLTSETLTLQTSIGGALILLAALFSALQKQETE